MSKNPNLIDKLNGTQSTATTVKLKGMDLTFNPPSVRDTIRVYNALEEALNGKVILDVIGSSFPDIPNPEDLNLEVKLEMFGILSEHMSKAV